MKAGTLEIEILTNIARLQQDMAQVKRSVGGMTDEVGRKVGAVNDNMGKFAGAAGKMGQQSRMAGHHLQNLTFQLNDVAVGLMSGQKPMTVFMQQGTQIAQIMAQSGVGMGGMVKQLGGMVAGFARAHPYLAAAAVAAAAVSGAFAAFASQIEGQRKAELDAYVASLGLTREELEKLGPVGITAGDVFNGLGRTILQVLGIDAPDVLAQFKKFFESTFEGLLQVHKTYVASFYAAFVGTYNGVKTLWSSFPAVLGDAVYGGVNLAIRGMNYLLSTATAKINEWLASANAITAPLPGGSNLRLGMLTAPQIGEIANPYAGAGVQAGRAFIDGFRSAYRDSVNWQEGVGRQMADNIVGAAKDRLGASADKIIGERSPGGKAAKAAAGRAGKSAGDEFMDRMMKAMDQARATLIRATANDNDMLAQIAQIEGNEIRAELEAIGQAVTEKITRPAREAAEAAERLAETLGLVAAAGRGGRGIATAGAILQGLASGQTANLPGRAGALIGLLDRSSEGALGSEFRSVIESVFGNNGEFTKKLDSFFGAGALGMSIGGMVLGGKGSNFGSFAGGIIGKELGKEFLSKGLEGIGKGLGKLGGPLGTIAGSLLGGLLGSVFKKTKTGSASIGAGDFGLEVTGTSGNSGSRKRAAGGMAGDIIGALDQIAMALGGAATGDASVSIGLRNSKYRVDTTGQGRTKGAGVINFGKDQEAAIKAAIADAIADGAITGLSESMLRLLKAGDLERQLQKATDFKGALDDFRSRTDPLNFALDQLAQEFERLASIAREAGASAAEQAQLEELLALRREEAVAEAQRARIDQLAEKRNLEIRLLELLGRESDALAASREMELFGLKESLRPMQMMINQLEDARAIIDQFGPLAEDLKAYRRELLGQGAGMGFAELAARFRDVAALAANGDATALGNLRGAGQDYLAAALANAASDLDYRRITGQVLNAVDAGIFAADTKVDYAQAQLEAINRNADILVSIRDQLEVQQDTNARLLKLWERFEGDGLTVKTDADTPLKVETIA